MNQQVGQKEDSKEVNKREMVRAYGPEDSVVGCVLAQNWLQHQPREKNAQEILDFLLLFTLSPPPTLTLSPSTVA